MNKSNHGAAMWASFLSTTFCLALSASAFTDYFIIDGFKPGRTTSFWPFNSQVCDGGGTIMVGSLRICGEPSNMLFYTDSPNKRLFIEMDSDVDYNFAKDINRVAYLEIAGNDIVTFHQIITRAEDFAQRHIKHVASMVGKGQMTPAELAQMPTLRVDLNIMSPSCKIWYCASDGNASGKYMNDCTPEITLTNCIDEYGELFFYFTLQIVAKKRIGGSYPQTWWRRWPDEAVFSLGIPYWLAPAHNSDGFGKLAELTDPAYLDYACRKLKAQRHPQRNEETKNLFHSDPSPASQSQEDDSITCPACSSVIPPSAHNCPNCGKTIWYICPKCAMPLLHRGGKFCTSCGAKL